MLWIPSRSTSNEYPQDMFLWRNKKNINTFVFEKASEKAFKVKNILMLMMMMMMMMILSRAMNVMTVFSCCTHVASEIVYR